MKSRRFVRKRRQRARRLIENLCASLGVNAPDRARYAWFQQRGEPIEELYLRVLCDAQAIRWNGL